MIRTTTSNSNKGKKKIQTVKVKENGKSKTRKADAAAVQLANERNKKTVKSAVNSISMLGKTEPIAIPPPKKLERSNSFFLTRKLSKIYNTLTGSKDNLNKIPENADNASDKKPSPFKFTRSASLATIPLRRDYRCSMRESKLEQLSEEESHGQGVVPTQEEKPKKLPTKSTERLERQSSDRDSSFSLISSLKRTFSVTPAKRKSYNSKWSASLMNLQQIDSMISYEDLSFIDYDKFNTYEAKVIRNLSQTDVNNKQANRKSMPDERTLMINEQSDSVSDMTSHSVPVHSTSVEEGSYFAKYPEVKRRIRPKRVSVESGQIDANQRNMFASEGSVDDRRQITDWFNQKSYRWSNPCDGFKNSTDLFFSNAPTNQQRDETDSHSIGGNSNKQPKIISQKKRSNSLRKVQSMNNIGEPNDAHRDAVRTVSNSLHFSIHSIQLRLTHDLRSITSCHLNSNQGID